MSNAQPSRQLTAALRYRDLGLSIIPVKVDASKRPDGEWKEFQKDAANEKQLHKWYGNCAVRGLGIVGGEVSGNLLVLDFERVDLFDRWRQLAEPFLIEAGIDFATLPIVETPRPGRHVYLTTAEPPPGNDKLAKTVDDQTLIETRGEGGMVIAPGSPGQCHPTGKEYTFFQHGWIRGGAKPVISMALLDSLLACCRALDQRPPVEEERHKPTSTSGSGDRPGDKFNQKADWRSILEPTGAKLVSESNGVQLWRRPGKEDGISATVGVHHTRDGYPLLIVHSTSWGPFTATSSGKPKGYTPFEAYTLLNHRGDRSVAARAIGGSTATVSFGKASNGGNPPPPDPEKETGRPPIARFTAGALIETFPRMNRPVVNGLFREGETANIVSLSKFGKTWLTYGLALSIVTGRDWLGKYPTDQGRVLIIDNELHKPTIASRLKTVADAMGILLADYADGLEIWPLRGNLRDIYGIEKDLDGIKPGEFKAIILDAKYRMMPADASENDNAHETQFYNQIDRYAERLNAAILGVHHASKGAQADKRVTDVGAGAGAQSRAADAHLVLREHEEENVAVLDAAVRSFPPVEPMAIRWSFPLWVLDEGTDPANLKGRMTTQQQKWLQKDQADIDQILKVLKNDSASMSKLRRKTGVSQDRLIRLLAGLVDEGRIRSGEAIVSGNACEEYTLIIEE